MSKKKSQTSSSFCVLPWIHLASHPHGGVSLCCLSDHFNNLNLARNESEGGRQFLKLGTASLRDIFNSDYFRLVRRQMLEGKQPEACHGCFKQESLGIESKRIAEARIHGFTERDAREITDADGRIDPNFKFVELRLGNNCNLKCRTCNPASSTKWRADYDSLSEKLGFIRSYAGMDGFDWPESQEFWDELDRFTPNLTSLYINGGEPMLYKKHASYLEKLVADGRASKIDLVYSSNITVIPEELFGIWKNFKQVEIKASIDDLRERNRYIRFPADWAAIERNLNKLLDHGVKVMILQTVSAMNAYYLDEFQEWASEMGVYVAHNYVFDPDYLSFGALPAKVRQAICWKVKPGIGDRKTHVLGSLFGDQERPELWTRFQEYTQALDKIRNESFNKTFPELCKLLEELK